MLAQYTHRINVLCAIRVTSGGRWGINEIQLACQIRS
jgi:hypothetical protein